MSTVLPLEHETQVKILVPEIVRNSPNIVGIWMSYEYAVVCIDHLITVSIYITWITGNLRTIQGRSIIDVLLRKNTVLLHDINTIHGFPNAENTVLNIKRRRDQNFLLVAY